MTNQSGLTWEALMKACRELAELKNAHLSEKVSPGELAYQFMEAATKESQKKHGVSTGTADTD